MSRRLPQTIDVDDEEASHTVGQLVFYLKGAYNDREHMKVERLLTKREETIRAEMEKKVKREAAEEVEAMKKEVESAEVKYGEAVLLKLVAEESVKKLERECEGLRDAAETCEMLKRIMRETEEKLELKAKTEERLRKKAEEDLRASESKFKELELRVLNMQKDIDLIDRLEAAGAPGMEVEEMRHAEASESKFKELELRVSSMQKDVDLMKRLEASGAPGMGVEEMCHAAAESEARNPVRAASRRFEGADVAHSVKTVGKIVMEGVNLFSRAFADNMKGSDPLGDGIKDKSIDNEKRATEDAVPGNNLGQPRPNHGYIQISSDSSVDGPSKPKVRSKDVSDFNLIKEEPRSQPPFGSDRDKSNLSPGLKRKRISSFINDDRAETDLHPAIDKGILPKTQEGRKERVGNVSLTGSLRDGDLKSRHSNQPLKTAEDLKRNFE